jgi:uncharacterized SAM-binding protein YcdF (DUF218 family)
MAEVSRILEALVTPLGLIWVMQLAATVVLAVKRKWRGAVFTGVTALILFVFGCTSICNHLLASLERPYAGQKLSDIPRCDAVIMLGGVVTPSKNDLFQFHLGEGADRAVTATELVRQGKAPVLVLGGGGNLKMGWSEGELLRSWLAAWHLSESDVITIPVCANTHEEALRVQALSKEKGWKKVILVTSAYHMKRAEATFRQLEVPVIPFACDFIGLSALWAQGSIYPVPSPERFEKLSLYLHEKIGWWIYRWRGWLAVDRNRDDRPR